MSRMRIERGRVAVLLVLVLACATAGAADIDRPGPAGDCTLAATDAAVAASALRRPFPPVQLEVSAPFAPTRVPSGGFHYLVYELHLRNFTDEAMAIPALEVFDAGGVAGRTVARLSGAKLQARLRPIGAGSHDQAHRLEGGRSVVLLLCLAFDDAGAVPETLGHRLLVGDAVADGPFLGTRHVSLKVLAPPVRGKDWVADNGPSLQSHHRTGVFVTGGRARLSRRFAIDWKQREQGATYAGDALDVGAYFSYGEKVYAVADATVVSAVDGLPDNVPRTAAGFDTAVPLTLDNVAGNAIVLDLGDGQFAYYAHLRPGSVRVRAGDRVRRGEPLAEIGNSGDSRWPHLHFQVATGPDILDSEGLPFLIDRYRARDAGGAWHPRVREYPIGDVEVEFGTEVAPAEAGHRLRRDSRRG